MLYTEDGVLYEVVGRIVLFGLVAILMGMSIVVMVRYVGIWKTRRKYLSRHIWAVALSYYLLLAALASRNAADWRVIFWLPALLLGIYSMWVFVAVSSKREEEVCDTVPEEEPGQDEHS